MTQMQKNWKFDYMLIQILDIPARTDEQVDKVQKEQSVSVKTNLTTHFSTKEQKVCC